MACDDIQIEWGYSGPGRPENWSALSAEYRPCGEGVEQSPVNITGQVAGNMPPIAFQYASSATEARNNGHTVYLDFGPGSSIVAGDRSYQLAGVHYHSPGEHQLDGETFAAELHLVHQDAAGGLAVVGLLYRLGVASPLVQALLDAAPSTGATVSLENGISAAAFVPDAIDYYGYNGSLTTPPCTEGVRWILMQAVGTVSQEQVDRLQALTGGPNNRPIQPIGRRAIVAVPG